MSIEGGLSTKEYGGAHEKLETGTDVNKQTIFVNILSADELIQKNCSQQILTIQDGDIKEDVNAINKDIQFSAREIDIFQTQDQTNSQWLRNKNDSGQFDISSSDEGEIFEGSCGIETISDATVNDSISFPQNHGVISSSQMFVSSLDGQTILSIADSKQVNMAPDIQSLDGSEVVGACADKLQEEANSILLENIQSSLGLDLPNLSSSSCLSVVQQQVPIKTLKQMTVNTVPTFQDPANVKCSGDSVSSIQEPRNDQTILVQPASDQPQVIQATAVPQTIQVVTPQQTLIPQGDLKYATISISTDQPSNSTHILVNTTSGNQLYRINTSDLQQATNALKPPGAQQNDTPKTGYLLLNPEPTRNGMVSVFQMEGGQQKLVQMNKVPFLNTSFENRKVFVCPVEGCQKMFRRRSKFKTHQMRHTGERPYKCSKPGCEWAFTTHYKLKRHEESHEGKKDFMCPEPGCNVKFTTVYNLNSHIKLHSRPCTEKCPVEDCGQMFVTKRQLDAHMRIHNGHERKYKCPHEGCNKVFISALSMGSHPRVHQHQKADYICSFEGCGKKFDKACRLNQHMRSHTGEKPFVCQFEGCSWAFTTASKLKRHESKHTGIRKWICDTCGKAFMRSEHLKGHKVTHSGERPFACPIEGCDLKFTAKSTLIIHIKKHENGGKKVTYHCPMEGCVRKYSNKPSLRAHIVKHVKQVMTENNNSQGDGSNIDIMPYLDNDLPDIGLLAAIDGSNSTDGQTAPESTQNAPAEGSSNQVMIDPSEFIASSESGEVQQISPEVINQILSSMERQDTMVETMDTNVSKLSNNTAVVQTLTVTDKGVSSTQGHLSCGSARTDYYANHLMSERAKKRRNKEVLNVTPAENNVQADVVAKNNYTSDTFTSGDGMTSRGITFRDPETGVLYLQTQLLQDDPPNTVLYCDEGEISPDLPVTSCTPLHDSTSIPEFSGSTINLQDLQ